jgi:hypothetical protein
LELGCTGVPNGIVIGTMVISIDGSSECFAGDAVAVSIGLSVAISVIVLVGV